MFVIALGEAVFVALVVALLIIMLRNVVSVARMTHFASAQHSRQHRYTNQQNPLKFLKKFKIVIILSS